MKGKIAGTMMVLGVTAFFISCDRVALAAEDAFSILAKLEEKYVGLERPGLETLIANVKCSAFPDVTVMIYWAKDKGLKTRVEEGGPGAIAAKPIVEGFVRFAGLGIEKMSEKSSLTKENATETCRPATLKDGTKVYELTFIPKEGQELGFTKMVMMVDTKEWVIREVSTTTKEGEALVEMTYEKGLLTRMVTAAAGVKTAMTNTYGTKDKFTVPDKTEITMEGKDIPEEMKLTTITYSEIKINSKIPEEIFAEPKPAEVPKPTETAAVLFQQAQEAMQNGNFETAKLKLRQIVSYYPNDPMAATAEMILKQLPE